jgi:hypothetical protein
MVITFENDKDVIVYALEKVISYARANQYIFVAQSIWWISSIIGLQQELILHIDNLKIRSKEEITAPEYGSVIHPDRLKQVEQENRVSPTPRDLTEDQRLDSILEVAEHVVQDSFRDRSIIQRNRVNPLPQTKAQLKKARKIKRLQEAKSKTEAERIERLAEIRSKVIRNLSKV